MGMRHQLAAYSPVSAAAAARATAQIFGSGGDPRPLLRSLLEREYGSSTVLLCGSGTQALTIAIREGRKRVDPTAPVALPAFTCFDVASAAVGADARISLYDLDPDTLAPDLSSLERVLRAGAGVVVVAPLYGLPVDWRALVALAARHDAVLIEDAAQGHGASWDGRRLGTLGDIATLSFGRAKGWTGGNGGAVFLRTKVEPPVGGLPEPDFHTEAANAFALLAHWAFARPAVYAVPLSIPALRLGQTTYRAPKPANLITRAAAATLLSSHAASQREAAIRQENAKKLLALIGENSQARTVPVHREGTAGYLRLPVRLPRGMATFESQPHALARGIAPSYPLSLAELPQVAERLQGPERNWPGAQILVRELVTLPTHSRLRSPELDGIAEALRSLGA